MVELDSQLNEINQHSEHRQDSREVPSVKCEIAIMPMEGELQVMQMEESCFRGYSLKSFYI
jgi:hypothetical protein